MPGRRIQTNREVSPELKRLLEAAKGHEMTPGEKWDQRVSWVYGQLAIGNPNVKRGEIVAAAIKEYGPRPES